MFRLFTSSLYDQTTFCDKFDKDTSQAKERNIRIIINTKPFEEHEAHYQKQSIWAIGIMQNLGIEVLSTIGYHRKLAIIDDDILYEQVLIFCLRMAVANLCVASRMTT